MTTHRRLQRTMASPGRAGRRAKKLRRQAKYPLGRPAEYRAHRLPESWLAELFGGLYAHQHRKATQPRDAVRAAAAAAVGAATGATRRAAHPGRQAGRGSSTSASRRGSK